MRPDGAQVIIEVEVTLRRRQRPDGAWYTIVDAISHPVKAEHSDLGGSGPCLHGLSDSISGRGWQGDYINDLCVSISPAPARHDLESNVSFTVLQVNQKVHFGNEPIKMTFRDCII